ncbi:MAG TPA: hypothetical protein VG845_02075 [Dehalococcoidia bacterium]|jgi:hypothetical protein|nr:hypothetical protein [Dehalococcoidia bacterium]
MDEVEARTILEAHIQRLRGQTYAELRDRLDDVDAFEETGPSGSEYQLEAEVFWDDPRRKEGNLRVLVSIDDGRGWRAFSPLTDSFIKAPDESFVGE